MTTTTLRTQSGNPSSGAPTSAPSTATAAPYVLPDLPYQEGALAPVVSAQIMELHHTKHHATYVKNANQVLAELAELPADADSSALTKALAFNVGGHVLHSLFWTSMTPDDTRPSADLSAAITQSFGSQAALEKRMSTAIAKLCGSGWAMLAWEPIAGRLVVSQLHDHQSELIAGSWPLLVIDGWEHAYYLDYHADRAKWGERFFDIADWDAASERFANACNASGTYL